LKQPFWEQPVTFCYPDQYILHFYIVTLLHCYHLTLQRESAVVCSLEDGDDDAALYSTNSTLLLMSTDDTLGYETAGSSGMSHHLLHDSSTDIMSPSAAAFPNIGNGNGNGGGAISTPSSLSRLQRQAGGGNISDLLSSSEVGGHETAYDGCGSSSTRQYRQSGTGASSASLSTSEVRLRSPKASLSLSPASAMLSSNSRRASGAGVPASRGDRGKPHHWVIMIISRRILNNLIISREAGNSSNTALHNQRFCTNISAYVLQAL
jgi:hypothetical protein